MSRLFLDGLKRVLSPRGLVVFNLYSGYVTPERLNRLQATFRRVEIVPAASNRIVFCRS